MQIQLKVEAGWAWSAQQTYGTVFANCQYGILHNNYTKTLSLLYIVIVRQQQSEQIDCVEARLS